MPAAMGQLWACIGRAVCSDGVPPGYGSRLLVSLHKCRYSRPAPREGGLLSPGFSKKRGFPRGQRGSHPQHLCALPVY